MTHRIYSRRTEKQRPYLKRLSKLIMQLYYRCSLLILRISLACVRHHKAGAAYSILDIIIASVTFWIASFRRPWALRILHRVYPLDLYLLAWAVYRTCGSCASLRLILTSCLNQEIIFLSKFRNIPV